MDTCKILEYIHTKDGIIYRVYDLYHNPDKYIAKGKLPAVADVIAYSEANDIREYFDLTYRIW